MADKNSKDAEQFEQARRLKQFPQTGRLGDINNYAARQTQTGRLGDFFPEEVTKPMLPTVTDVQNLHLYIPGISSPLVITPDEEVSVGRSNPQSDFTPDLDLAPYQAATLGVSRYHGTISAKGGQYLYKDMGSTNGSFINAQRLTPFNWHPLNFRDKLRIGHLILTVG